MISKSKYRLLVWAVIILLASNISMGLSFLFHEYQDKKTVAETEEEKVEVPAQQRTKYFREQLNLDSGQVDKFREWNREFNRTGWEITLQLENLRIEMVEELGKEEPDSLKLAFVAEGIGKLHTELKNKTISYYMKMKAECNEEQQARLNEIFMDMLKQNEDVKLPGGYGRNGRGFRNNK